MFELSPKQSEILQNTNARLNFLVGSVRSGKTFVSLMRWLQYIQRCPEGNLIMVGRTASTIKRNIIDELCNFVGAEAKYFVGKGELNLWGKRIYLVGCSDERAEQKIRGSTFAGAYVDEATLIPESFWSMLMSRLSIPNAKLFATTNPDSPFHYLKTDYLDRIKDENHVKVFQFNLNDNPSLDEDFKRNLMLEYRGLWYKRYIEGEWCLAEGTIYDFFDERIHITDLEPGNARYYIVGVDYGTTNPCAFVLLGYNPEIFPNIWVEDEYYYDSKEHNRQKTDSEYADDLKKFISGKYVKAIIIDPSAASFKAECINRGIDNIVDADNDVLNGIRTVSNFLSNGTLKVCRKCKSLIKEMYTYVWDEKSVERGEDKPKKQNDHCLDGLRYSIFTYFRPMYEGDFKEMQLEAYRRWKAEQGWQ